MSCTASVLPMSALERLVAESRYHGFGCLAVKGPASEATDLAGAIIEMSTRRESNGSVARDDPDGRLEEDAEDLREGSGKWR